MTTLDQRISYLEKLAGVKKEEPKEPEIKTPYWDIGANGKKQPLEWGDSPFDYDCLKAGNCFWKESDCDDEILRRESMAGRIEEPEEGEMIYFYSFETKKVHAYDYDKSVYSEWLLGAIFNSKEECKSWAKRCSNAFNHAK